MNEVRIRNRGCNMHIIVGRNNEQGDNSGGERMST